MSSNFIRWSGLALVLGGVLDVMLYFVRLPQDVYIFVLAVSIIDVGLLLSGLLGLQTLQSKQSGVLGLIAVAAIGIGFSIGIAVEILWWLLSVSMPDVFIVYGIIAMQIVGFVLLGISINRAAVFPRHTGTGLIIVSLLTVVMGTRLFLAIFLAGVGYRMFAGKVPKISPI